VSQMASMTIIRTGQCACGCGEAPRPGSKYADYERCRQRAYRQRVQKHLRDAGLPDRLNLRVAEGAEGRHGDAQAAARKRTRRSPDLRISYRKAVDAVAAEFARCSSSAEVGRAHHLRAERTLVPLLTDRQRAALKEQR
jgi:hypothetical protein